MSVQDSRIGDLLEQADLGDHSAIGRLLEHYRGRLRTSVARQFDRRLSSRVDPSDVVQETLIDARRRLPEYLRDRPVGFFPWLRGLANQRLIGSRRFHLGSSRRSVARERPDDQVSTAHVLDNLACDDTSPSGQVMRDEEHERMRQAIATLGQSDREILELRYFNHLPFEEIAEGLGAKTGAVKMRHLRAIERLRVQLDEKHEQSVQE
jgi:RNA polymerase sigma-70 factor (ECF subfamily)